MFDLDFWEEIWQTIKRNRKRSLMTAFGVFWGILMLVVMAGAGIGMQRMMMGRLAGVATNSAFLFSDRASLPYKGMPSGRWWQMDLDDVQAVKNSIDGVQSVVGTNWGGSYNFSRGDRKGTFQMMGYMPDYQKIIPQSIDYGRFINDIDMEQRRKVCVIGNQVYKELFPEGGNPVGQELKMNGGFYTVVGSYTASNAISFSDGPRTVIVPLSTLQQMYNSANRVNMMAFTGDDDLDMTKLEDDIKALLRSRHTISPDDKKAIGGFNLGEQFAIFSKLFLGISLITWIVGVGTLLAGIVGVSNIMLVVVRERTQEIGVRRALGAPPRTIITQIMSESFVLTFVAGVAGLFVGVGILSVFDSIMAAKSIAQGEIVTAWQISFSAAISAAAVLMMGGIIAGIIPAYRAILIKPVDAIREE